MHRLFSAKPTRYAKRGKFGEPVPGNSWLFLEFCVNFRHFCPDMEFVQKFTPLDFQVKNFTPSILPNFNSFSKKKTQKMSENGEIYTAGNKFYTAAGTDGMDKFHL